MANRDYGKSKSSSSSGSSSSSPRSYSKMSIARFEDGGEVSGTYKQSDEDAAKQDALATAVGEGYDAREDDTPSIAPAADPEPSGDTRTTREKVQDFGAAFIGAKMPNSAKRNKKPSKVVSGTGANDANTKARYVPRFTPPKQFLASDTSSANKAKFVAMPDKSAYLSQKMANGGKVKGRC